ncbi:allophanate hydrolase [Breoghania sp.]|uniref:allophanate hydrolase n=1 Tax=Breoghania sp. TaxID=2065378 RepID=UPI002AAB293D|nr:allophanate hydrolase [Breoghania sp.]
MLDLAAGIPALHAAYAAGIPPQEMIAAVFGRIDDVGDPGIFIHLADRTALMDEVRALGDFDPARPLWGVPFAVKDNIDVAGMPTTAACRAYEYRPECDAFVVARLKAAGAIVIGKTNLDQFATGLVGVRTPYPAPKNAIDPALVPGGSSSGSAVAVAHGIVSFSLGTDTAGSGRVPAALNDLVGLKPSVGALSATGMIPACRTLDCMSVFARNVADAWTVFAHAAVHDPQDAYSRTFAFAAPEGLKQELRIGVPPRDQRRFFGDAAQAAAYQTTLDTLAARGAEIVNIDFAAFHETADLLYEGAWVAERYAALREIMETRPEILHPVTRRIVSAAEGLSAADAFEGLYRLKALERITHANMAGVDCLCVPTIPRFVTVAEIEADPITPNSQLGTYTNFVNLLDLAALAVPVAPRSDGLPGNVTLIGEAGSDGFLAGIAASIERGR